MAMTMDEFTSNNCGLLRYTDMRKTRGGTLVPRRKYELYLADVVEGIDKCIGDRDYVFCKLSFDDIVYNINECYYFEQFDDVPTLIESRLWPLQDELASTLVDPEPCPKLLEALNSAIKSACATYPVAPDPENNKYR
jgi:hypothetical protein